MATNRIANVAQSLAEVHASVHKLKQIVYVVALIEFLHVSWSVFTYFSS